MMQETGVVTAIGDNVIRVQTKIKTTCGGCQQNDNCGTGVVARAFAPKNDELVLPYSGDVRVGQQVTLGIPENNLLSASALVYLLPLIVVIASVLAANYVLPLLGITHELWTVVIGLLAGGVCFAGIKQFISAHSKQYQPQLLAVLPVSIDIKNIS